MTETPNYKPVPEIIYEPVDSEPGPDYTLRSGQDPCLIQGTAVGIPFNRYTRIHSPADTLAILGQRQTQVQVGYDPVNDITVYRAFQPTPAHSQLEDLPVTTRGKVEVQTGKPLNSYKKRASRPKVVFPGHNPAAKIPKTGGFRLKR